MKSLTVMTICILFGLGLAACQPVNPALTQGSASGQSTPTGVNSETKQTPSTDNNPGPNQTLTLAPMPALQTKSPSNAGLPPKETLMPSPFVPDANSQKMLDLAKNHLARKLNIALDRISEFTSEAVRWPDTSLGCPRGNFDYAMVITPGYRFLLEANGQTFDYHTNLADQVILCDAQSPSEIYQKP